MANSGTTIVQNENVLALALTTSDHGRKKSMSGRNVGIGDRRTKAEKHARNAATRAVLPVA